LIRCDETERLCRIEQLIEKRFCSAARLLNAYLDSLPFAAVDGKFNSYGYELQNAQIRVQVLEGRLRQRRIARYGPGSEELSNLQPELLARRQQRRSGC
jgi:hypothetical protein